MEPEQRSFLSFSSLSPSSSSLDSEVVKILNEFFYLENHIFRPIFFSSYENRVDLENPIIENWVENPLSKLHNHFSEKFPDWKFSFNYDYLCVEHKTLPIGFEVPLWYYTRTFLLYMDGYLNLE